MPRKVWVKSIFPGDGPIEVRERSLLTQDAYGQWNGWSTKSSRRPGLRQQLGRMAEDLDWIIQYVERMIDEGITHTWHSGETTPVIDEDEEEWFYEYLEWMRDSINDAMKRAGGRRPLRRRIALIEQTINHPSTEPELRDAARNRLAVLKKRLEEGGE